MWDSISLIGHALVICQQTVRIITSAAGTFSDNEHLLLYDNPSCSEEALLPSIFFFSFLSNTFNRNRCLVSERRVLWFVSTIRLELL